MSSKRSYLGTRAHPKLCRKISNLPRAGVKVIPSASEFGRPRCQRVSSSSGASFVEFIITGILVLIVFWAGVEFGSYLRIRIRLVSILRETSSEMYRECFGLAPDPICLRDVAERVDGSNQSGLPGFGVISSFYVCTNEDILTPPHPMWRVQSTHAQTRTSRMDGSFPMSLRLLCASHLNGIVISEGFYTYQPVIPFVWRLIGFSGSSAEVYAPALF